MPELNPDQLERLRNVLKRSRAFDTDDTLRAFFIDPRISPWRHYIKTAPTTAARLDQLIDLLCDREHATLRKNVLVLFLHVLGESLPSEDIMHNEILTLAEELSSSSLAQIYRNLPHPDYEHFVGRESELARIHDLLQPYPRSRYHIITIKGIGGIGKSALALEVARRYVYDFHTLPQDERFDAVIWASAKQHILTGTGIYPRRAEFQTLDDIYTTIAATLEREDITQARSEERPAIVAHALACQRTLLIIDNLEVVEDGAVISFIHDVPDPTKVIVTTRRNIDVAMPVNLLAMSWEETRDLIVRECHNKNITLNENDARELHRRTGGVPLAMVWSLARLALGDLIENVLLRLARPDSDIARYCFEGVMQQLQPKAAYSVLLTAALFPHDVAHSALAGVTEIHDQLTLRDSLIELERLSLLNRQEQRYSLLPLTRMYLAHEIEDQFEHRIFEQMLVYYQRFAAASQPVRLGIPYWDGIVDYTQAEELEQEWPNVEYVIRSALERQRHYEAFNIFLPVVHTLNILGLWDTRLDLSRNFCQVANQLGDPVEVWLWIDAIGFILLQRGQTEELLYALNTGRALARKLGINNALTLADVYESELYIKLNRHEDAEQKMASALDSIDTSTILEPQVPVLRKLVARRMVRVLGHLRKEQKDFERARHWYKLVLDLRRDVGEPMFSAQMELALVSLQLGDISEAERYLGEARPIIRKEMAWMYWAQALLFEAKGEMREAARFCRMAVEGYAHTEHENWLADCRGLLMRLEKQLMPTMAPITSALPST